MAASDIYPLSTQDGKNIPLDVVKPKALIRFDFVANAAADITIPAGYALCWAFSTKDCILSFGATDLPAGLVAGTNYPNTLFIPAGTPLVFMATEGECSLLGGADAGSLYINSVEQWAALTQPRQASYG